MYHPWNDLRGRADVVVSWRDDLPAGWHAATHDGVIVMSKKLTQVERRCALTHELVHIDFGHKGCQPEAVERAVRRETAIRLIDIADLIRAARWAMSAEEMADELWVTVCVLIDRINDLSRVERLLLDHAIVLAREGNHAS